ncbi:MAG TPA: ABC transporter permease [Phycisphaerae bacterium]|nr:ABC transporter permease [Phycisphaerae bacterium]
MTSSTDILLSAPAKPALRPAKPYLTIQPKRGLIGVNLRELWLFRDLCRSLIERDVKLRYKQTALGVVWVLLQPLLGALIFSRLISGMAGMQADESMYTHQPVKYFLYAFTGLVVWNLFSGILSRLYPILVSNSSLVSKVYFPRLLLPFSGAVSFFVDLTVSMAMLVIVMLLDQQPVGWPLLLAPAVMLAVFALSLGLGMWAAALSVQYRDVAYVLPVILPFLMFISPTFYPAARAVGGNLGKVYYLNPLAGLLSAWKWSILGTPFPPMWTFAYALAASFGALLVGVLVFRRMERDFADVI